MKNFTCYKQMDSMDCGPTCLRMIAKFYGKSFSQQLLRNYCGISRSGVSMQGISDAAERIGLRTMALRVDFETLKNEVNLPCIVHWNHNHFVVVVEITKKGISVADPAFGLLKYSREEFLTSWLSGSGNEGTVLMLNTTPDFFTPDTESTEANQKSGLAYMFKYLLAYKSLLGQLLLGLLTGSLLQLVFPFLTRSVVDIGIQDQDIHFIYLVLFAQVTLFISRSSVEIIRSWILMHISSRISIALVSDFFIKLMNLPMAYFDSKNTGDIMQRVYDHHRIENFLTSNALNTLFSVVNLIVFSLVLMSFSIAIYCVFLTGSIFYLLWIIYFQKYRASLDAKQFANGRINQSKTLELIQGMQEIKLQNAERKKLWEWEQIQIKLFKVGLEGLRISQLQNAGSGLINELKNIFITFLSAKLVIEGRITLGEMVSINYITGQLNLPILQLIGFLQSLQDAKLSLNRLSEVHKIPDEEDRFADKETIIKAGDIVFNKVSFRYPGGKTDVLKDISMVVPKSKITAIVGTSGSGKTTLIKLLLRDYIPVSGEITIGKGSIGRISIKAWRKYCGVVMQEGYIFSDSIKNNITVGDVAVDQERLVQAAKLACIDEYIDSLPSGYTTKIGSEGNGISVGQKQRLLIARAIYRNPEMLLFDEATSALDTGNENKIMTNLNTLFEGRTVLIIAHRLSTVKNADQIVVLNNGRIAEVGKHRELISNKGIYYTLVKNQLEFTK